MTFRRALIVAVPVILAILVVLGVSLGRPEPAWVYQYSGAGQGPRPTAAD